MQPILIIAGGILGLWFGGISEEMLGIFAGAGIGYLFAQRLSLQKDIRDLKDRIARLAERPPPDKPVAVAPKPATEPEPTTKPEPLQRPLTPLVAEPAIASAPAPAAPSRPRAPSAKVAPAGPTAFDNLVAAAKRWLTTGNVPVKLGVIVSFFGVAFLLKYAVDREVLTVPIELRYLGVATGAGIMLAFGWRLRARLRVYALSLQGGGIGVLFLTIFAAFRLHPLLPAPFAFFLLVALTAFAGVLAVLQDAKALAVLGIVGGFLAPVLISTGSGNHVGLFSYYLLLNAAILGIAWFRAWRFLNVIGFVFTFGVGTLWGYKYYKPELFTSTEPFLIAYFVFYQAIAILFAFRQPPKLRGLVDGTLIFGTPVIAFALQSQLVENTEYGLAISSIAVAVFYTLIAVWLHKAQGKQMRLLIESFVALGVAFATIAIPLALDGRWTATAWALEGAALVWVGVRQEGLLAKLTGAALLGAAGIAYMDYGWPDDAGMPILNGDFLGGMLIGVASLFSARYLAADKSPTSWQWLMSVPLLVWGLAWWGCIGVIEIMQQGPNNYRLHMITVFIAISVGLLAWLARRYDWTAARRATLAYLPLLPIVAVLYLLDDKQFFAGFGLLAWTIATIAHFGLLRAYDNGRGRLEGLWHFAGALFLVGLFAYEIVWRMDEAGFSDVWGVSCALLMPLAGAMLIVYARGRFTWPLQRYWTAYLAAAGILISAQLLFVGIAGIENAGDPAPLPYVPILNPFDVLTIVGLVVTLRFLLVARSTSNWLADNRDRTAFVLWAVTTFVLTTISVVRGVHHFSSVSWHESALTSSVLVQSALSIYWAILGFGGMIWGARHANRWIWLTGTALMALVVVKLFLVDLGNTGTVARIVSFLGVGVLLLVVGYLAPAPPKKPDHDVEMAEG